ncbi:MAG TPA: hypothetical protein VFV85_05865 [Conexibacter sp.]|nr:hypothetical protein [Conexibacter sp.]
MSGAGQPGGEEPTERREVRAADPSLSPAANRVLTEELRRAVGRDAVDVPRARPHAERERHGGHGGVAVGFEQNRLVIAMAFLAALVVGAVVSLVTGSWWFLLLAFGLDVLGVIAVVVLVLSMTTQVEHLSPSAYALLQDEGVEDPDAFFSELVEEYAPQGRAGGARPTPAHADPAQAAAEQRSAVTPSEHGSRPVGP